VLSLGSFQAIVGQTPFISNVSLVGLRFSDMSPGDLSNLLSLEQLDIVRVDQVLFNRYTAEFNAFDAIPGNTVTVVPEPLAVFLCTVAWIPGWTVCQRRRARKREQSPITALTRSSCRLAHSGTSASSM
jgi:hypothetical protein